MANKSAVAKISLSYTGPDNEPVNLPTITVTAPYQAQLHASADVIDTLGSGQDIELPFGSIDQEATLLVVENRTKNGVNPGQRLTLNLNAGDLVVDLAIGESAVFGVGVTPDNVDTPITSAKVTTTEIQAGAGLVSYHVFGDPVV